MNYGLLTTNTKLVKLIIFIYVETKIISKIAITIDFMNIQGS